jgi:hypothetical protein
MQTSIPSIPTSIQICTHLDRKKITAISTTTAATAITITIAITITKTITILIATTIAKEMAIQTHLKIQLVTEMWI